MNAVSRLTVLLVCGFACPSLAQSIVPAADGTGTIVTPQGQQIQIRGGTEAGQNLFHSFDRFNLDANQTAMFFANPAIQTILGRVVSSEASRINGLIQVNGNANLVLMNPAGILFGSTARLDVPASFTATTADRIRIGSGEFSAFGLNSAAALNGTALGFEFLGLGGIFNAGALVAPQNVSLLGGTVLNTGTVTGQTVTIAAVPNGRSVRVTPEGSLISLELPASSAITTQTLPELLTGGELQSATQAVIRDGIPTLTNVGTAIVSGKVSGSNIQIMGERIGLIDATVQGESIRVGEGLGELLRSQVVFGNETTQIEGRNIALRSDQTTRFRGSITASNGFIETSSKQTLEIDQAKISANGGTWLLNSSEINIVSEKGGTLFGGAFDPRSAIATIDPVIIEAALNSNTNVAITTANGVGGNGDITLSHSIAQTRSAASLTLAARQFFRTNDAEIKLNGTNNLTFNVNQVNAQSSFSASSIQAVIDAIGDHTKAQISLGAGTYTSTGIPLLIAKDVTIRGNTSADTTLTGNHLARVIEVSPGVSATIENLTISDGKAPKGQPGGGILNLGNTLLQNVALKNNQADAVGGAIANKGAIEIDQSRFTGNRAVAAGAIHTSGATTITNSILSENVATGAGASGGGAIFADGRNSVLTVSDSQLLHNRSGGNGGAIDSSTPKSITLDRTLMQGNIADKAAGGILSDQNSALTITNSQILDNRATGDAGALYSAGASRIENTTISNNVTSGGNGGGIYATGEIELINSRVIGNIGVNGGGFYLAPSSQGGTTIVRGTTIADNISAATGGGIASTGKLSISDTTLSGNLAIRGGGLFIDAKTDISNTTISGNTAIRGGGIYVKDGKTEIESTTIANNRSTAGGIDNLDGTVQLRNTIVAENVGMTDVMGRFDDEGNNLIGVSNGSIGFKKSLLVGTRSTPITANLAPLANNGGLTQTHALLPNSLAINSGNNRKVPDFDQTGRSRIQGRAVDIGAFESSAILRKPLTRLNNLTPSVNPTLLNDSTPPDDPLPATAPDRSMLQASLAQSTLTPILKHNTEAQQAISTATELERSLSAQFAQYYGFDSPQAVTLKDIQTALAKAQQLKGMRTNLVYAVFVPNAITPAPSSGEVLTDQIEPITPLLRSQLKQPDDRLDLVLVTATGRTVRYSTTATRAHVAQQAKLFRLAISDAEDNEYKALSKQLYQWLVEPLEAQLQREGIQGLIYCLDEGLRTVPIAAMSDDQGYVVDRYAVSVIPSVTLFNREIHSLSNQTVLAVGADHFRQLEPLPAVPIELKLISEQVWKGTRLLNQNFTLKQLLQEKQRTQAGILHLATHAQFNPGSPDRSFIQLWDQPIKLSQMSSIAWTNPTLHLLVLSACDTAIDSAEAELGFTGLAAAAGVHSVLGSLWGVSDVGTLALMSEFYTQLQKTSTRAEALRRAQTALRNGTVRIENGALVTSTMRVALPPALTTNNASQSFQHPYYWSGFTLVGNPW